MTRRVLGLLVCGGLLSASPVRADAVTDWNAIASLYITTGRVAAPAIPVGRAGPPGLLDFALVHAAVHDAVQAITGQFQPYHYADPAVGGIGSPAAAAAAAAHRVLVLLYPGQQTSLDALYTDYLGAHGLAGNPGIAAGEAAAIAVHAAHYRAVIPMDPFFGSNAIGQWRSAVPMGFLYLGFVDPYTLNRPSQFRPPPPPPLTSGVYAREYDEVKARGNTNAHPNGDTDLAHFWSANFFSQWNEVLRQVAEAELNDINDSARLFALANLTAADTAIAIWDSKVFYNFWRPSTAIHEAANDRNARTAGDVAWAGLIGDPPYPDYVSGANGVTAAFTASLRNFFGTDEMAFSVKTTAPSATTKERFFTRFSQAADEVVDARILLGIHFRAADEEARRLGERVAHWVSQKFLRPVPGDR
jgi:hypothetical protein